MCTCIRLHNELIQAGVNETKSVWTEIPPECGLIAEVIIMTVNIKAIYIAACVEREFSIGDVRLRGIRLCEPCDYLARLTSPEILRSMLHKAGLRAAILSSGTINLDDVINL
jgi:hypothetical protein